MKIWGLMHLWAMHIGARGSWKKSISTYFTIVEHVFKEVNLWKEEHVMIMDIWNKWTWIPYPKAKHPKKNKRSLQVSTHEWQYGNITYSPMHFHRHQHNLLLQNVDIHVHWMNLRLFLWLYHLVAVHRLKVHSLKELVCA